MFAAVTVRQHHVAVKGSNARGVMVNDGRDARFSSPPHWAVGGGDRAGFFKIAGEPVRTRLEIDVRYGYAEPVDSSEVIEVSERDLARKNWLAEGQARIVQAANERARRFLGE